MSFPTTETGFGSGAVKRNEWAVFSTNPEDAAESFAVFDSYHEAKLDAMCRHCSNHGRRLQAGLYRINGENYASYVVRGDVVHEQFADLLAEVRNGNHQFEAKSKDRAVLL